MSSTISSVFISEVLNENPEDYIAKTSKTTVTINQHLIERVDNIAETIGASRSSVISELLSFAFKILDLSSSSNSETDESSTIQLPLYSIYVDIDEDGDSAGPSFDPFIVDPQAFKAKTGIPFSVAYRALCECRRYDSPEEDN